MVERAHLIGYFGVESMFCQLWNQGVWWPKMRSDLKAAVQSCIGCLRFNIVKEGFHPLQSIEADKPWDHIQIDTIGPLPSSAEGYCNILTLVDVMTGYTVLRAAKTHTKEETAKLLWNIMIEYGVPKILQSDNRVEFVNGVVQELTRLYGIDHRLITPYHPRADGLVERKNKEVGRILKKQLLGATENWQQWLPVTQLALNLKELKRTGCSPFELMFGRPFNEFSDFQHVQECLDVSQALTKRLEKLTELRDVVLPAVADRTHQERLKRAVTVDSQLKQVTSLVPGTQIMAIDKTRGSKWDPIYEGPFTVVRQNRGGAYELKDATGEIFHRKMTIDMLKPINGVPHLEGEKKISVPMKQSISRC